MLEQMLAKVRGVGCLHVRIYGHNCSPSFSLTLEYRPRHCQPIVNSTTSSWPWPTKTSPHRRDPGRLGFPRVRFTSSYATRGSRVCSRRCRRPIGRPVLHVTNERRNLRAWASRTRTSCSLRWGKRSDFAVEAAAGLRAVLSRHHERQAHSRSFCKVRNICDHSES